MKINEDLYLIIHPRWKDMVKVGGETFVTWGVGAEHEVLKQIQDLMLGTRT